MYGLIAQPAGCILGLDYIEIPSRLKNVKMPKRYAVLLCTHLLLKASNSEDMSTASSIRETMRELQILEVWIIVMARIKIQLSWSIA